MYGSILYNCWSALVGFTVYFVLALQNQFVAPIAIIVFSSIAALGAFLFMFPIRYLLNFILFTPEPITVVAEQMTQTNEDELDREGQPLLNQSSKVEFGDESTEDIAKVVRTMMHQETETRTAS